VNSTGVPSFDVINPVSYNFEIKGSYYFLSENSQVLP